MNPSIKFLSALGFGLALAVSSQAQTTATGTGGDAAGAIPHSDKSFVLAVAEGSNQEVALSQLAAMNSLRQDVKDFAQMMIRDHGMLNTQLAELAARKGVDIADAVAKGQKKGVDSLAKKQGADFDEAYLQDMVEGHDATLKAFTKEANKGKDADVQAFASKNLPTIQMHDDHAHSLQQAAK
jgi:putative membrane protein